MIAGTLGRLDPVEDRLESWCRDGGFPALDVQRTQSTTTDATPQSGMAATRIEQTATDVYAGEDTDGKPYVARETVDVVNPIATEWCADVTGSGVVLAESIAGDEEMPFPFDLVTVRTGSEVDRQRVDVAALHSDWDRDDDALDIWMESDGDEDAASIAYHDAVEADGPATTGLGFQRAWGGTVIRGVVWESGYVALYSANHPAQGLQFIADELLPYCGPHDEVGGGQATLAEASGGDGA